MKSGATLSSPPVADPTFGIRQFTVGTGGAAFTGLGTALATTEVRNTTTYGVLKLTLHATTYDWAFLPIAGSTFTDSARARCMPRPTAPRSRWPTATARPRTRPSCRRRRASSQRHRRRQQPADGGPQHQRHPRHAGAQRQRWLHLHPDHRLQRSRQLHLPRQRRHRQLQRRDRVADGQCPRHSVSGTVSKSGGAGRSPAPT